MEYLFFGIKNISENTLITYKGIPLLFNSHTEAMAFLNGDKMKRLCSDFGRNLDDYNVCRVTLAAW